MVVMVSAISLSGCVETVEGPPHFLHVASISVVTEEQQGTDSHRIEEVWVYSETDVLGAFPLPADIPLSPDHLSQGSSLVLSAGIRANAISATRQPYPFYEAKTLLLDLESGGRDTVTLELGYTDQTVVILAEDFENANRFVESVTSTAEVQRTEDPAQVFEGIGSGAIRMHANAMVLIAATNEQQYDLYTTGPVWLELDYACSQPFAVGLAAFNELTSARTPILVLNTTEGDWNKIYLDLGPYIRSTPDADFYEITIDAFYDGSSDTTYVLLDNFKLLRYP